MSTTMERRLERQLTKALLGDAEARRELAAAVARTPETAEIERIQRVWDELELPPPAPSPPGFAPRLASRARGERNLLPGFALSPAWSGLGAALLVAIGVVGGLGLGAFALPEEAESESLVEWVDYGELGEQLFAGDPAPDPETEIEEEVAP